MSDASKEGTMRVVALEEHYNVPDLFHRIPRDAAMQRGWPSPSGFGASDATTAVMAQAAAELGDLGRGRVEAMDAAGITVQVLSAVGPLADVLEGQGGVAFARDVNDRLARAVAEHPSRFAGFATLPTRVPAAAADELERAVRDLGFHGALIQGLTQDRFLDDPIYDPLLARAEQLDVPLYLHPGVPPESVRKAYYGGLPPKAAFILASPGFGWHAEVAIHVLRLVLSETLDRHPRLRLIIGHMGEMLPVMLARCDDMFGEDTKYLKRTVSQTILDHVVITTSGFFSNPPFLAALLTFGVDRILFSVDYPFSRSEVGRAFLERLPVSPDDRLKIAHGNADRVLRLSPSDRKDAT
jgi:uncharacterized protein